MARRMDGQPPGRRVGRSWPPQFSTSGTVIGMGSWVPPRRLEAFEQSSSSRVGAWSDVPPVGSLLIRPRYVPGQPTQVPFKATNPT